MICHIWYSYDSICIWYTYDYHMILIWKAIHMRIICGEIAYVQAFFIKRYKLLEGTLLTVLHFQFEILFQHILWLYLAKNIPYHFSYIMFLIPWSRDKTTPRCLLKWLVIFPYFFFKEFEIFNAISVFKMLYCLERFSY